MKKIILSAAISLDGLIEGPNGEYDWCTPPAPEEMDRFLDQIDTIFYGRKSFELTGPDIFSFGERTNYVFSNSLKQVKGANTHLISGDVLKKVMEIRQGPGKDIWLFGGAELTTYFINHNLVDEMYLGLVPIILGSGKPLFQNIESRKRFEAVSSERASTDLVYLTLKKIPVDEGFESTAIQSA